MESSKDEDDGAHTSLKDGLIFCAMSVIVGFCWIAGFISAAKKDLSSKPK